MFTSLHFEVLLYFTCIKLSVEQLRFSILRRDKIDVLISAKNTHLNQNATTCSDKLKKKKNEKN